MKISNKAYDILKWVSLVVLDAIGVFYDTISIIWNLPFGDEILKTCAALSLLVGALIGISSERYKKDNEEK